MNEIKFLENNARISENRNKKNIEKDFAFEEYKNLKQKIYFEKNEKKKEEISKKLEELGEKYNF